ncbi:ABC transporter permease subunit [Lacrimispora brassicae]
MPSVNVLGVNLPLNVILTISIGLVMMAGLQIFIKNTKMGKAMRAVPQDRDASILAGINVNKVITMTFAIGSALVAVAALMYCTKYPRVTNDMGSMMGL